MSRPRSPASADAPLAAYNAKRDFQKTAEPAGKKARSKGGNLFIVQKHAATRLHWDFRLEVDGVLKSWAVTKGPSADPDDRRLAVRTEDHPLAYAEFEGTIPKGEYGGGTVMLWDKGTWAPIPGKSAKDIEEGHLHFTLQGDRMKGEWLLVRMKPRPGEKRENWLLRKVQDDHVEKGDVLVEGGLTSVLTGRSMAEIAADKQGEFSLAGKNGKAFAAQMDKAARHNSGKAKPRAAKAKKHTGKPPAFRTPQLATLVDAVPSGNQWMHEIKFDGYRALIAAAGDKVVVYTRNGHDWTDKFAPLAEAIAALDLPACLIDGEIVAYGQDGNPDFSSLQQVLKRGKGSQTRKDLLDFFAFDLLELEGEDLTRLPNIERKERLEVLLAQAQPPIRIADHVIGAGEKLFAAMCAAGQEGIIAKKIDAGYVGKRMPSWVKVKCISRQEFVVVGWTRSTTTQRPFASLLLAQYEEGGSGRQLVYKGKVGTGFNGQTLADVWSELDKLGRKTAPLDEPRVEARGASWVEPKLVAEVAFAEFTADGRVRHASFLGLRADKPAEQVEPERPAHLPETESKSEPKSKSGSKSKAGPKPVPTPKPESKARNAAAEAALPIEISNPDRVIFPESGQTKGQLAAYYQQVADLMLPFAGRRPISLVRCPQGRAKKCFFQKHDSGTFGDHVHHVPVTEKGGGTEDYLYVEDATGLLQCVQMGTIEFHGWGSLVEAVERPDRMIFDLDPDEGLDFGDVKSAATDIRDRLAELGLTTFAMLSGGKGVHVIAPLTPGHDWETHKDFARRFAEALALAEPDRFVATMSKAKRKGKIFIDWLRNQRGATAVVPYSARARAGAPVAVPIAWPELDGFDRANVFSIADGAKLVERAGGKALAGWGFADQALPGI